MERDMSLPYSIYQVNSLPSPSPFTSLIQSYPYVWISEPPNTHTHTHMLTEFHVLTDSPLLLLLSQSPFTYTWQLTRYCLCHSLIFTHASHFQSQVLFISYRLQNTSRKYAMVVYRKANETWVDLTVDFRALIYDLQLPCHPKLSDYFFTNSPPHRVTLVFTFSILIYR